MRCKFGYNGALPGLEPTSRCATWMSGADATDASLGMTPPLVFAASPLHATTKNLDTFWVYRARCSEVCHSLPKLSLARVISKSVARGADVLWWLPIL
jgi:hypothetical protein